MADGYVFVGSDLDLVHDLEEVRGEISSLKKRESELREKLLGVLGEERRGLTASGSQICSVQVQHRRSVNRDKLEALYPEVFAEVIEESTVTILKLG